MAVMTLQQATQSYPSENRMLRVLEPAPSTEIAILARQLAADIADAADADQWAIAVVGVERLGDPDFEEVVPRAYLEAMNDGRPARYRLTLVLRTAERDLGIVRLATLRPPGFSDLDVARARRAAEEASHQLDEALRAVETEERSDGQEGAATRQKQGVVIFDEDRQILAITPVAQELLGWQARDVVGASCASVFDCRNADGAPMCDQCALGQVFHKRAIIEPILMHMSAADGRRQPLRASFWYLPPSGRIQEPRAMAVFRAAPEQPMGDPGPRAG